MAIIRALLHSNYEVLVFSDEINSPWADERSERIYGIEYSHREYESGFEKVNDEEEHELKDEQ
jgi:hypothetical protein